MTNKLSDRIDQLVNKIDARLDRIITRLDSIDVTLAKQEVSLSEHIRRTELLEDQIEPIKKHVNYVNGVFKFIALLSIVVGILKAFNLF